MPNHASNLLSAKNVLLIHTGALGDFILTLHLVERMRTSGARICYLGRGEYGAFGMAVGLLDRHWDIELSDIHRIFGGESCPDGLAEILILHDLALMASAHPRRDMITRALSDSAGGRVVVYDPRPDEESGLHVTEQWQRRIHEQGFHLEIESTRIALPHEAVIRLSEQVQWRSDLIRVVIQPGSGGRRKNWSTQNFMELASKLANFGRFDVRFLIGPVERETWPADELERIQRGKSCLEGLSLFESAAFVANSDLYIGNDSGMSHLAAALGTRVIAIFGTTRPEIWRPLGGNTSALGGANWPTVEEVFLKAVSLSAIVDT